MAALPESVLQASVGPRPIPSVGAFAWPLPTPSVELEATFDEIVRLGLRHGAADLCVLDVLAGHGASSRWVAVASAEGKHGHLAAGIRERAVRFGPTERALQTGRSQVGGPREVPNVSARGSTLQPRGYLAVPLVARGETLGVITWLTMASRHVYTGADLERAEPFARSAALALATARLYASSEWYRRRIETMVDLVQQLGRSMVPDVVAERIVASVRELFHARAAALYRLDTGSGSLVPVGCSGSPAGRRLLDRARPRGHCIIGLALTRQCGLASRNVLRDPRVILPADLRTRISKSTLRSVAAAPLLVQHRAVGVLAIADAAGRLFRADERHLLATFADRVAEQWQNARLFARTRRQRREAVALEGVAREITSSLDEADIVKRVVERARALCRADLAFLATLDAPGAAATVRSRSGADPTGRLPAAFPVADGGGAHAGATTESLSDAVRRLASAAAWAVAPIRFRAVTRGFLAAARGSGQPFARREHALLRTLADQAAIAMENAHRYRQAEELAATRERMRLAMGLHDTLSQLLFSVALKLDWCRHQSGTPPTLAAKLAEIDAEVGRMFEQIRRFIGMLAPENETDSLPDRLNTFVSEFRQVTGVDASLAITGDPTRVDSARQEIVSKSVQEALANVARHARAARVAVTVHAGPRDVTFEVVDDGIGPPPGADASRLEAQGGHFGLRHIRERLAALGGRLVLTAGRPSGFRLRGTLPLTAPR